MSSLADNQLVRKMRKCGNQYSKRLFIGVFPRDALPKGIVSYPCSLIINTDTKNLPGKHWVAVYISSYKEGEYFDSFGREPSQDIALWLNKFTIKWKKVNSVILQNPLSTSCGQFVLFYVNEQSLVRSHFYIVNKFHADTFSNEQFVKHYYQQTFESC